MDVNKLKHVLTDLKTLSDVVDKEVVKKMYMIIGSKNLIPLILPDLLLLKKTDYDANDIKFEIPSVSGLVTAATLNAVDNERPDMSNLVKKQITVQKISDFESKYLTTFDYNKSTNTWGKDRK